MIWIAASLLLAALLGPAVYLLALDDGLSARASTAFGLLAAAAIVLSAMTIAFFSGRW